ncbi:MAG: carboxymuconolactone decarboxylase family protein [Acidimicrobiales bacterium]
MNEPRIAPLPVEEWADGLVDRATAIVGGELRTAANVYRTLANSPALFESWLHLGGQLLRRSTLPSRDREIVILRTTALAGGAYPFTQHDRIAQELGVTPQEIEAVLDGPTSLGWGSIDRLMLTAVDELMINNIVSEPTWNALSDHFNIHQVMDLIATVAFYRLASWMLNVCATPLDEGQQSSMRTPTIGLTAEWKRAETVRVPPVSFSDWPQEFQSETATWPRFVARPESRNAGVYTTLANHVDLFGSLGPLIAHFLNDISLNDRHRELVIVRSCCRDRGEYPYRQHVAIGRQCGLAETTIAAAGTVDPLLGSRVLDDPTERALVRLVDELHDTNTITDETWHEVAIHFDTAQVLDTVALAGFYGVISFVLNCSGTELEQGDVVLPELMRTKT